LFQLPIDVNCSLHVNVVTKWRHSKAVEAKCLVYKKFLIMSVIY